VAMILMGLTLFVVARTFWSTMNRGRRRGG
jgi:hypothetical protein